MVYVIPVTTSTAYGVKGRSAARETRQAAVCALLLVFLALGQAQAQEMPPGVTLVPTLPRYFVARDAFVRAAPDNAAERIGSLAKGRRVAVLGKALVGKSKEAHWVALKLKDGRIGFVFAAAVVPAIDGSLRVPLKGKLAAPDRPECRYTVTYEGRSQVADDVQQTADYDVAFECSFRGTPLAFAAGMFITELPFQERRDVFQINIDLWDMRVNDEDVLSVTALYDPMAKRVAFESVNDETLGNGKNVAPRPADNVPGALAAALAIAHAVWRERAWERLASLPKPESDKSDGATP